MLFVNLLTVLLNILTNTYIKNEHGFYRIQPYTHRYISIPCILTLSLQPIFIYIFGILTYDILLSTGCDNNIPEHYDGNATNPLLYLPCCKGKKLSCSVGGQLSPTPRAQVFLAIL